MKCLLSREFLVYNFVWDGLDREDPDFIRALD